jgi:catechol 2,3-dioxygenase-like lactoylglutathione lyase family enzyme
MPIVLDHLTVPVQDQEASVRFYSDVFAARRGAARGRIVGVWLSEILELQLRAAESVESSHYAFRLDDQEFATVLDRIKSLGIAYGPSKDSLNGELLEETHGKKSVFFSDPNGHSLELIAYPP